MQKRFGMIGKLFKLVFCLLPLLCAAAVVFWAASYQNFDADRAEIEGVHFSHLSVPKSGGMFKEITASIWRGQLLVGFDCDLYAAQLSKVEATADAAAKVFAVNQKLSALHSVGELDVQQAKAKAKEADAEAVYMRETVDRCQVTAPFSGRVAKRLVAQYEYVAAGKPLLQIVDTEDLELKLIVPSAWLSWLRTGTALRVHIEDLKADYNASIVRLGARVDPVSQTLEVSARIKGSHPELLPGMSGWAHFPNHS